MVNRKADPNEDPLPPLPPARSPAERENQLIALAFDLVEDRMRRGTATSQETTHFLKLGSSREQLEQALIAENVTLQAAKVEAIASAERIEKLYKGAIDAMRAYGGQPPLPDDNLEEEPFHG